jgi:hypothetical protein
MNRNEVGKWFCVSGFLFLIITSIIEAVMRTGYLISVGLLGLGVLLLIGIALLDITKITEGREHNGK